jgi:hypothetical protein
MAASQVLLHDAARNCLVHYEPQFLAREEADELFDDLCHRAPWQSEVPVMFGRAIEVRGRTCAYGDRGLRRLPRGRRPPPGAGWRGAGREHDGDEHDGEKLV